MKHEPQIGFIGQGWIGKNYADDFVNRGHAVVRYSLEPEYIENKAQLADCDILFIAVPTPTTEDGFSLEYLEAALSAVPAGATAVIKSTMLPGSTKQLQQQFPDISVFHSPEFLVEKTAATDAAQPKRNIVGIPEWSDEAVARAEQVLAVLPTAPYEKVMRAEEAEVLKYAGNCFLFTKVMFMNILFDYTAAHGGDWDTVREALVADPRIGETHTQPVLDSGRGAGGHCFIKDFEAFLQNFSTVAADTEKEQAVLAALRNLNVDLLTASGKDLDLLEGVYGKNNPVT